MTRADRLQKKRRRRRWREARRLWRRALDGHDGFLPEQQDRAFALGLASVPSMTPPLSMRSHSLPLSQFDMTKFFDTR